MMTDYDRWGPWTGEAIKASRPYSVRRRRTRMIMSLVAVAMFGVATSLTYFLWRKP